MSHRNIVDSYLTADSSNDSISMECFLVVLLMVVVVSMLLLNLVMLLLCHHLLMSEQ